MSLARPRDDDASLGLLSPTFFLAFLLLLLDLVRRRAQQRKDDAGLDTFIIKVQTSRRSQFHELSNIIEQKVGRTIGNIYIMINGTPHL